MSSSAGAAAQARERLLEEAHEQQQLVSKIRQSVAAISELSSSIVGERNEQSSDVTGSQDSDDDEEGQAQILISPLYLPLCSAFASTHTYTNTKGQSWPRGTGSVGRGAQGQ